MDSPPHDYAVDGRGDRAAGNHGVEPGASEGVAASVAATVGLRGRGREICPDRGRGAARRGQNQRQQGRPSERGEGEASSRSQPSHPTRSEDLPCRDLSPSGLAPRPLRRCPPARWPIRPGTRRPSDPRWLRRDAAAHYCYAALGQRAPVPNNRTNRRQSTGIASRTPCQSHALRAASRAESAPQHGALAWRLTRERSLVRTQPRPSRPLARESPLARWPTASRVERWTRVPAQVSFRQYSSVMATVAVFLALGGGAYAAVKLPRTSVGSAQINSNGVRPPKVERNSLTGNDGAEAKLDPSRRPTARRSLPSGDADRWAAGAATDSRRDRLLAARAAEVGPWRRKPRGSRFSPRARWHSLNLHVGSEHPGDAAGDRDGRGLKLHVVAAGKERGGMAVLPRSSRARAPATAPPGTGGALGTAGSPFATRHPPGRSWPATSR